MATRTVKGTIIGYDPGGNGSHGVATISVANNRCSSINVQSFETAEDVLLWIEGIENLVGLGVDTLACWSTGPSGWRAADLWLKNKYKNIRNSIVSPNGLYGSMGLNGMAVLVSSRQAHPNISITETHPKVLYWALAGHKHDYQSDSAQMDSRLSRWIGIDVHTSDDHEWDAAVSALAALRGMSGEWTHDLFQEGQDEGARLVTPCGPVHYWWPD